MSPSPASRRSAHAEERLVRELASVGISDVLGADEYLHTQYRLANLEFARPDPFFTRSHPYCLSTGISTKSTISQRTAYQGYSWP